MRKLLIVAAMTLVAVPAMAQLRNSDTATQAGGPLAGAQRAAGAPGGEPASMGMPMRPRMMRAHRRHRMMRRHHRRMM